MQLDSYAEEEAGVQLMVGSIHYWSVNSGVARLIIFLRGLINPLNLSGNSLYHLFQQLLTVQSVCMCFVRFSL
jgi:hypothetical protein